MPDGSKVRGKAKAARAAAELAGPVAGPPPASVVDAVQRLIDGLPAVAGLKAQRRAATAAQALALAHVLDVALLEPRSAAPTNKELRATIDELVGDDDQGTDPLDKFEEDLDSAG